MELNEEEIKRLNELDKKGLLRKNRDTKILQLRKDKLSIRQISFILKVSISTVFRSIKKYGN